MKISTFSRMWNFIFFPRGCWLSHIFKISLLTRSFSIGGNCSFNCWGLVILFLLCGVSVCYRLKLLVFLCSMGGFVLMSCSFVGLSFRWALVSWGVLGSKFVNVYLSYYSLLFNKSYHSKKGQIPNPHPSLSCICF